ncbi:MAG: nuclear transport factor 2 family protein [Kangiellaceae bacterium]|nr:nuclear transport factor 2 family protein [Kangiellaceae bacterium]MCW8999092.1 nuclear transport factor 2 family protein [Kangiellaceae bacterium]
MQVKIIKALKTVLLLIFTFALIPISNAQSIKDIEKEVANVERAFAKTMADRDFRKFQSFLDENAVFVAGKNKMRGKQQVAAKWKRYFEKERAPFAWKPETVVVIGTGGIALSTGPVWNPGGKVHSYYTSTWRKNDKGEWKIILDKGQKYCPPSPKKPEADKSKTTKLKQNP